MVFDTASEIAQVVVQGCAQRDGGRDGKGVLVASRDGPRRAAWQAGRRSRWTMEKEKWCGNGEQAITLLYNEGSHGESLVETCIQP